jgi:hypothetical protein
MEKPRSVYYGDLNDTPMPYQSYYQGNIYAPNSTGCVFKRLYPCNNQITCNNVVKPLNNSYDLEGGSHYYQMVPLMKGEPCNLNK